MTLHNPSEVKADIDARLEDYFSRRLEEAEVIDKHYGELWEAMRTLTLAGGKRLRPYMAVLSYEAYGGDDYDSILEIAMAEELLHLALLVHDDIIDKDYVRHGVSNVAGQYRLRYAAPRRAAAVVDHFANAAALIAGDLLLAAAHTQVLASGFNDADKLQVLRIIEQSTFEVGGGQHLDMEAVLNDLAQADPLRVARYKTAGYSFAGPLVAGAVLARAPTTDIGLVRQIGYDAGIAFQLSDDILGVFGDQSQTGKSNSNDLREGKRTLLAKEAYERAAPAQRKVFDELFGSPKLTEGQAQQLRDIITGTGALAQVEALARRYSSQANASLELLSIDAMSKRHVKDFLRQVSQRKR
jgi:geranylgeranyl pyrophosphate synthase